MDLYQLREAVVSLCERSGKPILDLSEDDYRQGGFGDLLDGYGSAEKINRLVEEDFLGIIAEKAGTPPAFPVPQRVLVFSPHPDDDVISMGGTLRRLVREGHDVHVAYQTSGDIAVGDEEVRRYLYFVKGVNDLFCDGADDAVSKLVKSVSAFLEKKKDGEVDDLEVQELKALIRRGEARLACDYNHIPKDHVHFLNLPFYESGRIEKYPVSERDVALIANLLAAVRPQQIFVAGDFADPHDTHRKCTAAVFSALDELKAKKAKTQRQECSKGAAGDSFDWLDHYKIWMYRGAWAEWDLADIDLAIPLTAGELAEKREAILKHHSQMESAPFPGSDSRLFWQRAEDRNRGTAARFAALGLPKVEAMEAFKSKKVKN